MSPKGAQRQGSRLSSYLWESLEKAKAWTPAEWPFNSNARVTSLNSPVFPKQTSHTFTSGVKPHDATNLNRMKRKIKTKN